MFIYPLTSTTNDCELSNLTLCVVGAIMLFSYLLCFKANKKLSLFAVAYFENFLHTDCTQFYCVCDFYWKCAFFPPFFYLASLTKVLGAFQLEIFFYIKIYTKKNNKSIYNKREAKRHNNSDVDVETKINKVDAAPFAFPRLQICTAGAKYRFLIFITGTQNLFDFFV